MDYSLLLAIEILDETEARESHLDKERVHQIGANRTSQLLK